MWDTAKANKYSLKNSCNSTYLCDNHFNMSRKPLGQTSAIVANTTWEVKKDQKFKALLSYIVSYGPVSLLLFQLKKKKKG